MKIENALTVIGTNMEVASKLRDRLQCDCDDVKPLSRFEVTLLVRTLRSAMCAAQELEERAMGNSEPKRGD